MQEVAPTHPGVEANVLLSPDVRFLRFARIVWCVLAMFTIGLFVIGTALRYHDLRQVCTDSAEVCRQTLRLRPVNVEGIAEPDAALRFHAVFYTFEQVALNVLVWAIAGVIVWRRSDNWMALLVAFWFLTLVPPFAGHTAALRWPWLMVPVRTMELLSVVCMVLFLFIFPSGRFVPQFMRWIACALMVLLGALLIPKVLASIEGTPMVGGALVLLYGSALVGQLYRYRRVSTASERQQTKWVLFGVAVAAVTLSGNHIWIGTDWHPDDRISPIFYVQVLIFAFGAAVIPITLGIAILRYRLFDIDLIISRALVWGVLMTFVIGVYLVVVGYLGRLLHWEQSPLLSLIAIGIITVVFQPLRLQVQRSVNRLMYGQRNEPYAVMKQLGQRLDATVSAEAVFQTIVEMTAKALRLPYVALYIHDSEKLRRCAEWRSPRVERNGVTAKTLTLPVTHQGVRVAELKLAPRQRNEHRQHHRFPGRDRAGRRDTVGSARHALVPRRRVHRTPPAGIGLRLRAGHASALRSADDARVERRAHQQLNSAGGPPIATLRVCNP